MDIVVAVFIFLVGIVILFYNAINYISQGETELDELYSEGVFATELLLGDEYPTIVDQGKINQT